MQTVQNVPTTRVAAHYTARHRHHLPGGGYTDWSEGIVNGRHSHGLDNAERGGFVADSVGSPVHRHAWSVRSPRRIEHGYTSGPVSQHPMTPAVRWINRFLGR